jgi:hypothetical protein
MSGAANLARFLEGGRHKGFFRAMGFSYRICETGPSLKGKMKTAGIIGSYQIQVYHDYDSLLNILTTTD